MHGAHVSEQAVAEARRAALEPLETAERDLRKRLKIASARAGRIVKALDDAATASVVALEGDALQASAARRAFLAAEVPAQSLERVAQRVRSALLRGDRVETYALVSVLEVVLPERTASPRLGDDRAGLDAARKALSDAKFELRDTTPRVAVTITARRDGRATTWILAVPCPFCGVPHEHGGGSTDGEPVLGVRLSHCGRTAPESYELVPPDDREEGSP